MTNMVTVKDAMELLGVKEAKAYELIARANEELREQGCFTISGRTPRRHFLQKVGLSWLIEKEAADDGRGQASDQA